MSNHSPNTFCYLLFLYILSAGSELLISSKYGIEKFIMYSMPQCQIQQYYGKAYYYSLLHAVSEWFLNLVRLLYDLVAFPWLRPPLQRIIIKMCNDLPFIWQPSIYPCSWLTPMVHWLVGGLYLNEHNFLLCKVWTEILKWKGRLKHIMPLVTILKCEFMVKFSKIKKPKRFHVVEINRINCFMSYFRPRMLIPLWFTVCQVGLHNVRENGDIR